MFTARESKIVKKPQGGFCEKEFSEGNSEEFSISTAFSLLILIGFYDDKLVFKSRQQDVFREL